MANRLGRFALYAGGGIFLLMVLGMIVSVSFGLTPEQISSVNSIDNWMYFRLSMYLLVVACWVPICRWLTHKKLKRDDLSEEDLLKLVQKREDDIAFLKTYWWKVALLFAFFELVFIQQMGL